MSFAALRFLFARRDVGLWRLAALGWRSLRAEGVAATWRRVRGYSTTVLDAAATPLPDPRTTDKHTLVVAGCPGHPRRWRASNLVERLELAGCPADLVDHPAAPLADYIGCYRQFVLQRVPHDAATADFVAAARAAGRRVVFDVDDLVVHEDCGAELPFLSDTTPLARELYVQQLRRIGQTITICDAVTTATAELAAEVATFFPRHQPTVLPNVASRELVARSEAALAAPARHADTNTVVAGYFAGTRTHDRDLAAAAPGIADALRTTPNLRLLLVGDVALPDALAPFADRIERRPAVPWQDLPALLRRADVHLVPLAPSRFTACKSELKWLEAALVERPVIASAVGPFRRCVQHGENGWLAASPADFGPLLTLAAGDAAARQRLGARARQVALARWTTAATLPDLLTAGSRAGATAMDPTAVGGHHAPRAEGGDDARGEPMTSNPTPYREEASQPDAARPDLPEKGWEHGRTETPIVDRLSDDDLRALNKLLPWRCFTIDAHGRRFGDIAWRGKRGVPQIVPDARIVALHRAFDLTGKHVLEIGCFEGVHTTALCRFAGRVTAVDSRIENVVKTTVRAAMFGCRPEVDVCDVENPADVARLPEVDVLHHVGVLYHLKDPVGHLRNLLPRVRQGLLLDTHVAPADSARHSYETGGTKHRYHLHKEGGKADVFSGMYDHAKWLLLEDLEAVLRALGFGSIDVIEVRDERNGPRARIHAARV
jgi:glycosyltransferase involved in cell wall biosynthesis